MPTLKQKLSDGCYIIVGKIHDSDGEDFCTWQVDDRRAIKLLEVRAGINIRDLPADFPGPILHELIRLKYVSTEGGRGGRSSR